MDNPTASSASPELALIGSAQRAADDLAAALSEPRGLPDSFTGYEITREIHRGGQGVVYHAIQKATRKKVAIKVLREGPFAGPRDRLRFEREIHILGHLKHPNIVSIHDCGEAAGQFYYVMDYIPGQPLDVYTASGSRSFEQTLRLFIKVCEAVNAAHLRGVIHRDLKPGNIRIDAEGEPHLLDFGLAKVAAGEVGGGSRPMEMTLEGQFLGSLPWASPEQASGVAEQIDLRTDVYSLGVILYQMLTARFPYAVVGNMRDVLDNILRAEPTRPSTIRREIDDEIDTIILKCLRKEPDRRYQSAGELARDIERYLAGQPIEAKRDSGWYVFRKAVRRHRTKAVFAVLLLLTITGSAAGLWVMNQRTQSLYESLLGAERLIAEAQTMLLSDEQGAAARNLTEAEVRLAHVAQRDPGSAAAVDRREQTIAAERLVNDGIQRENLGEWNNAHSKYLEAMRLDPESYRVLFYAARWIKEDYFKRGFVFRDPGSLEESLRLCEDALQMKEDVRQLWNLKSELLYSLGRLDEAEAACKRTLEIDAEYFYAYSIHAKIMAMQHRFDEALAAATSGAELATRKSEKGKNDDGPWLTLGTLQLHLGQTEAFDSLSEAKRIDKKDTRNWLLMARLYMQLPGKVDPVKALQEADRAQAFTELQDPRFKRILAQAHLRNRNYADARTFAEAAIDGEDEPAYGHLIWAGAETGLGNVEAAQEHLRQASLKQPEFKDDGVIVSAEKGLLWIDTQEELEQLRQEAERLIDHSAEPQR